MVPRKLKVLALCPQEYDGTDMNVTPCDRCSSGWDKKLQRCTVDTGAEGMEPGVVPECQIQDRCQHQIQRTDPCVVRQAGLICESALVYAGMSRDDAADHSLGFNAMML